MQRVLPTGGRPLRSDVAPSQGRRIDPAAFRDSLPAQGSLL